MRIIPLCFSPCITPAVHIHVVYKRFRLPLVFGGSRRKHHGFVLIPIGHSGEIEGQVVVVTGLMVPFIAVSKIMGSLMKKR